jgi:hypothetical protein
MGMAQTETTVLAAGPYQIRVTGEKKGSDTWQNPTVLYKSGADSLLIQPSEFSWNAKKRIATGKNIRLETGFQSSYWEIKSFEINLYKGLFSVLESNWVDKGTKSIGCHGTFFA